MVNLIDSLFANLVCGRPEVELPGRPNLTSVRKTALTQVAGCHGSMSWKLAPLIWLIACCGMMQRYRIGLT